MADNSGETDLLPEDPQANTLTKLSNPSKRTNTPVTTSGSAQFISGTVLAGRYRIVGRIGKGGMGEVYKAEDLELEQTVALKFLPESFSRNEELLRRFRGEVRNARQVSHRNVCRVFDIGETDGLYYITMEYIDGDDLSMLLRRIGRLPSDKAVEISREICLGLAAIHKAGILHRDLKPANIIVDSRGEARITDFGIAGLEADVQGVEARVGTPAYMSPEQADGKELTAQSDIYSLGLLLYEIFTGKQAYEGESVQELRVKHATTNPKNPSEIVAGIDPLVETVISRCLEKDPRQRPESAIKVAMSLPGGDPLQVALEAGQTPSPEMVAASPKKGALRPVVAACLLAAVFFGIGFFIVTSKRTALHRMVPLEKSPDVLSDRGRELAEKFGYPAVDSYYAFSNDIGEDYLKYIKDNDKTQARWQKLATGQPSVFRFWYRSGPGPLIPISLGTGQFVDPPNVISGMVRIRLDTKGRLIFFEGVPPRVKEGEYSHGEFDWAVVFKEAGFDLAAFERVEPQWVPPHAFDEQRAFSGNYPDQKDIAIRVEAAAYRGKLVSFEIVEPWSKPAGRTAIQNDDAEPGFIIILTIFFGILAVSAWLAVKNVRGGRSDVHGAFRVMLFLFAVRMIGWVFATHHAASFGEVDILISGLQSGLFWACFAGLMYLAFEPYLRKYAPELVISWNRLLAGELRDPLVGRDVLVGGAAAMSSLVILLCLSHYVPVLLGEPPPVPYSIEGPEDYLLLGIRGFPVLFLEDISAALVLAFMMSFLVLIFKLLLRRNWLGNAAVWLILFVTFNLGHIVDGTSLSAIFQAVVLTTFVVLTAARFGVLAMMSAWMFFFFIQNYPITTELSSWYAGDFIVDAIILAGLAVYGFYISTAGQKLWQVKLFGE
jgi:serine/threonine-protein kinase